MNKSVLWKQVQMILDNLSVLINRVASVVKTPTGKNQMLVTGGDGQSKWAERTHWEETSVTALIENETFTTDADWGEAVLNSEFIPVEGETYTVIYDDETYQCVAFMANGAPVIGNLSIVMGDEAPDTGEPFLYNEGWIITNSFGEDHTISVYGNVMTVHKLDPKYLPDGIGGGADWNANEGEPGYIQNRTHWEEAAGSAVIENVKVSSGESKLSKNLGLVKGKRYIVVFDEKTYECEARDMVGAVAIGNASIIMGPDAEDTGEPFVMALNIAIVAAEGEHTISVYRATTTVHKIDPKYLPDGVGGGADWNANEGEPGYIANKPFYDYEATVIPETKLVFGDMEGMMVAPFQEAANLEAGKTYKIKYNGVTYNCDCVIMESGAGWGNFSIFGLEDTGEPFLLAAQGEESMVMSMEGLSEATISIGYDNVKTIDAAYLPFGKFNFQTMQTEPFDHDSSNPASETNAYTIYPPEGYLESMEQYLKNGLIEITLNINDSFSNIISGMGGFNVNEAITMYAMLNSLDNYNGFNRYYYSAFYANGLMVFHFNMKDNKIQINFHKLYAY